MASEGKFTVMILWASELRAAAAAIEAVDLLIKSKAAKPGELEDAILGALKVTRAALYGCSAASNMVVCEAERAKLEPRETIVAPRPDPIEELGELAADLPADAGDPTIVHPPTDLKQEG